MAHTNYQEWLKSLNYKDLACIQEIIPEAEQSTYGYDGKWCYSIVQVVEPGIIMKHSLGSFKVMHYSLDTGEILNEITHKNVPDTYLVPPFNNMESSDADIISNMSVYPLDMTILAA